MNQFITYFCFGLLLTSCGAQRNLVYFSDLPVSSDYKLPIQEDSEPRIQTNDLLSISVRSLSAESNNLFNNASLPALANQAVAEFTSRPNDGYLVDKGGFVNVPSLGKVNLAGLTREEATEKLTGILAEDYIKSPVVTIRLLNFKVTVIGEVNHPATFTVSTERINVLEALGLAGDMTGYGKRENVLIVREKAGERTMTRIDLNRKEVMASPYFYLQQNDIVYVEPDKARALQVSKRSVNLPIYLSIGSIIAILLTRL
jgi:polysaccharide export outer membrane protein